MKIEIKYGLLTIIVGILWVMIEHLAGLNTTNFEQGEMARGLFAFLPFVFLFLGIRAKKKECGTIGFLAAWRTGRLIALVYSIGFAIWFWIYASFINISFLPSSVDWENKKAAHKGLTGHALEVAVKQNTKMYGGSFFSYAMLFVAFFVMGVVASGILAIIMKTRKKA